MTDIERRANEGSAGGRAAARPVPIPSQQVMEHACETVQEFADLLAHPVGLTRWLGEHHRDLRESLRLVRGLPSIAVETSDELAGAYLRDRLQGNLTHLIKERRAGGEGNRRILFQLVKPLLAPRTSAVAAGVLAIPEDPERYLVGKRMQSARTAVRRAGGLGLVYGEADTPDEAMQHLRDVVDQRGDEWRDDALGYSAMLIARRLARVVYVIDPDGVTLAVALVVVDRSWASLHLCISLPDKRSSDARYLLHVGLVQQLARESVRHLVASESLLELTPGTRIFQRRIGFAPMNLRVDGRRRGDDRHASVQWSLH
jgi:hypothetical protein